MCPLVGHSANLSLPSCPPRPQGSWSLAGVLKNPMASAGPAALWENREGHKHLVTPCKRPLRLLALCSARAHQVPQPGPPLGEASGEKGCSQRTEEGVRRGGVEGAGSGWREA